MTGPYRESSEAEMELTIAERARRKMDFWLGGTAAASDGPAVIVATAIYLAAERIATAIENAPQAKAKAIDDAAKQVLVRMGPGWNPTDESGECI